MATTRKCATPTSASPNNYGKFLPRAHEKYVLTPALPTLSVSVCTIEDVLVDLFEDNDKNCDIRKKNFLENTLQTALFHGVWQCVPEKSTEAEIFALDTWRALTELNVQAKEYKQLNTKLNQK